MSSILVTFPGRAGDLLWALPTIRALSRRLGQPIDLLIAGEFASMIPLLERQPYLARVVADPDWAMSHGWQPPNREDVISPYVKTFHLGYRRWPELPLPLETLHLLNALVREDQMLGPLSLCLSGFSVEELMLGEPWITNLGNPAVGALVTAGWSETHFELKLGMTVLLDALIAGHLQVITHDSRTRWAQDRPPGTYGVVVGGWLREAQEIAASSVFLGCNSGLHVLAVAVGTPVVMYEPMEARWNPIFFPLGWDGPQVQRVTGLDGSWTTDVRHTAELLRSVIARG